MLSEFIADLMLYYNEIMDGLKPNLDFFKLKWDIQYGIGEAYQRLCKKEHKKELGSFYTPLEVVEYMVDEIVKYIDYKANPNIRILDPSCGGGYFIIQLFKKLVPLAKALGIENPETHVMNENLFGFDIDENAILITQLEVYEKTGFIAANIEAMDFLIGTQEQYDIIIGNPPYMGHKLLTGEYRERLYTDYKAVFSDKGDLSYCFIKRAIDSLQKGGKLCFITSRYMLEALYGADIRQYISSNGSIKSLVDFYGVRIINGVGVDNIIFIFEKENLSTDFNFFRVKESGKGQGKEVFEDIKEQAEKYTKYIKVNRAKLKAEGWSFLSEMEEEILNKINGNELATYCESYQGIITGCDSAFVVSREKAEELELETSVLKPWIKNKNVREYNVTQSDEYIIYSDLIKDEEQYPRAIEFIGTYKERLSDRRECKKGLRRWYELQWGRKPDIFEGEKIVYPYKASHNRFALDKGNYFSADVYTIRIKDMFLNNYSYEFLTGILNSSIYEFYLKTIAKKLGDTLYDYYPNKIMTLRIPEFIKEIEDEAKNINSSTKYNIDMILLSYFNMNLEEYSIIRSWCL